MPTYKNSNTVVVALKSNRIEAGQVVQSEEYIESLPAGVTQIADDPRYVPVKFSSLYSGDSGDSGAIAVPAGLQQYRITVSVGVGAVRVEMNDVTTATLTETLVAGESASYQCLNRIVSTLKLHYLLTGTVAKVSIA